MSVNKVIIIGNLGADPETRTFQSGGKVCNLRVACSETWKDKSTGERNERTEWVSVAIFNEHHATYAQSYLKKGSKVYVEGSLSTRKWTDQSGADRYTTEVVVRPFNGEVQGLDKSEGGPRSEDSGQRDEPSRADLDDEIPF